MKKEVLNRIISKRENMAYDTGRDTNTCHAEKTSPLYVKNIEAKTNMKDINQKKPYMNMLTVVDAPIKINERKKGNKRLYASKTTCRHFTKIS